MAMAGVGINLATKFPHNQIDLCAYKTGQKGHKLPVYVNFRKSSDGLVNA